MSYTLVLVGGTGQRFGLGLGYLNLLGIAKMPDRVVVVDAEGASGTNRITTAMSKLMRFGQTQVSFKHLLPYAGKSAAGRDLTVAQCVDPGGSELFPLCYSEDETKLSISEGFYATPKLAALVFRGLLNGKNELFNEEFQGGAAAPNAHRRVFIVGSVAGGTGAGIMRELADAYRKASCHVFGIVFGRFFDIPKGQPTSEDLDRNARLGCDFLLNRDLKSPFDVLAMVGPPVGAALPDPVGSDRGLPHNFPGLLAALSLVTDAGDSLSTRYHQARTNNPHEDGRVVRLDLGFGARGTGEQINDTDIWFPTQDALGVRGYISLADARDAAEEARQRLAIWRTFPFEQAYGAISLFVERKLGKRVSRTLRSLSATGHISPETASQLWEKLAGQQAVGGGQRGAIGEAQDGLESFERWLADMVDLKTMRRRQARASELTPKSWREALEQASGTEPREQLDVLAQSWCIGVARGQWKARQRSSFEAEGGRWLFPYASAGCSAAPGELAQLATDITVDAVESRSYPTPFGQAHAFTKRIELGKREHLHDAETLWLAMSAGWLQIDVRDLRASASAFEQLAAHIEPDSRFTGVLRVRKGDDLPKELALLAGRVVGATHPSCGLWPGLRDDVRGTLKELDEALDPNQRAIARQVLRRWKESLSETVGNPDVAWWKLVQEVTLDAGGEGVIGWEHVRTRGPVLLDIGAQKPRALYVFAHEANRAAKCSRILGVLAAGARLESNDILFQGREIARIQRRPVRDTEKRFDRNGTLQCGYLDLDLHPVDLRSLPDKTEPTKEILRAKVGVPDEVFASWEDSEGEPASPRRPDLTWRRTAELTVIKDLILHIEPLARGSSSLRLHDAHKEAPSVPGIAFHPGRGKWVVWLRDPVTNPAGACQRVTGSIVRVEADKRSWILHFPEDSFIAEPQQIFATDGYKFNSKQGPVLPALPVKNEFVDLVQCDDSLRPAELKNNRLRFQFRLFGDLDVTWSMEPASFTEEDRLHVELWPDLPQDSWKRFWLGIETDSAPAYEYAAYRRSVHGYYELQTGFGGAGDPRGATRYVSVEGRPRLLWMGTAGKGAGFIAFPDGGRGKNGTVRDATIAVDFGTFRTALLVAVPSNQPEMPWPVSSRDPLPGHRRMIVDHADKAKAQRANLSLFPPTTGQMADLPGIGGTIATVLGSTVVFPKPNIPDAGSVPFQDFSIPFGKLELAEYPSTSEQSKADLKWGNGDTATGIRTAYLKAILLLGAAEAFKRGATVLNVRYSFPLAYDLPEALEKSFVRARNWLETEVLDRREGTVEVRLLKADSESNAGMKAAEAFGEWIVTLDLGGGTLDLGVFHQRGEHRDEPIAWDSVKLGASLVSSAYAANRGMLERTVRWEIVSDGIEYDYEPLVKDTDRLLRLAIEYAARVVAGTLRTHESKPSGATVTAVLLGSGWRWDRCRSRRVKFDAATFRDHYGKLMERRIEQLAPGLVKSVVINAGLLDEDREKLAVARGLARTDPESRDIKDSIQAPNGLDESGRPWETMVRRNEAFGPPLKIDALPGFPGELESVASFNIAFQRPEVSQAVLARLQRVTSSADQSRRRTALGLAYEFLTSDWFKR